MDKSEEFIGVRVPVALKKKLKARARKEGRSLSSFLKMICFKAIGK